MKTYTLHLICNGLTQGNLDGVYVGHSDNALCPRGVKDLEDILEVYDYPDVPIVFSSPLKRCLETAKIIFPDLDPLIIEGLIEYDFGEFDGLSAEQLKDNKKFKEWLSGDPDVAPPYGETNREFIARISETFVKIVDGILQAGVPETAIVTHGGVIMAIMALFALPEANMTDWRMDAGFGYTCRITPSLWSQGQKIEAIALTPTPKDEYATENSEFFWADVESSEEGDDE